MPAYPASAMSAIAAASLPPQVIDAYPILISDGAAVIGVSKYERSVDGYSGGGNRPETAPAAADEDAIAAPAVKRKDRRENEVMRAASAAFLEHEPERHLHHSWRPCRNHLAESRVHLVPRGIEAGDGINRRELRLVENVIDLPAKLQAPIAAQRNVLEQRHVRVVHAGSPNHILGRIARVAAARPSKRSRVEPLQQARV